ncbi:MAG: hypothetical protein GX783_14315, partial [Clostridiales bacterium]|nr:hypothetical protein [Clostridiales bacterium]
MDKKMLDSHSFKSILKCVEQVETIFQPLASVSVRARVLGNCDVYSFKVRDISDKDIPALSILEKESRPVNSLLPPIRRTKHHNDIVHLESFLITQVERRWKRRIAQVEKLFMNVCLEPIKIFIETMEPIGFYLTALTFAEKMVDAGYHICRPE